MSFGDPIELRAERLRVLITAIGEEPAMDPSDADDYGLVPGGWDDLIDGASDEDIADELDLAWECALAAMDLRLRQWAALAWVGYVLSLPRLDPTRPPGPKAEPTDTNAGTVVLTYAQALQPAYATLGWDLAAPEAD